MNQMEKIDLRIDKEKVIRNKQYSQLSYDLMQVERSKNLIMKQVANHMEIINNMEKKLSIIADQLHKKQLKMDMRIDKLEAKARAGLCYE